VDMTVRAYLNPEDFGLMATLSRDVRPGGNVVQPYGGEMSGVRPFQYYDADGPWTWGYVWR